MPAYPADYLACSDCEAPRAQPCYSLFAAGPEALPSQFADRPHPSRKTAKAVTAPAPNRPTPAPVKRPAAGLPARRKAAKTSSQVAAWQSLAAKQRGKP